MRQKKVTPIRVELNHFDEEVELARGKQTLRLEDATRPLQLPITKYHVANAV